MDTFCHQLMAVVGLHTATHESSVSDRQSLVATVSAIVADHLRVKQDLQRIQQEFQDVRLVKYKALYVCAWPCVNMCTVV